MDEPPEDSSVSEEEQFESELAALTADLSAQDGSLTFADDRSPILTREIPLAKEPTRQVLNKVGRAVNSALTLPRGWHVLASGAIITIDGRDQHCIRIEVRTWPSHP